MTIPTHLVLGLIVGKVTGSYEAALAASVFPDFDHIGPYLKSGVLFNPKKLWRTITSEENYGMDQRNFFHNVIFSLVVSSLIYLVSPTLFLAFGLAYLGHLALDALDRADYYPFFPNKRINLKGLIKYNSPVEWFLASFLLVIFFLI